MLVGISVFGSEAGFWWLLLQKLCKKMRNTTCTHRKNGCQNRAWNTYFWSFLGPCKAGNKEMLVGISVFGSEAGFRWLLLQKLCKKVRNTTGIHRTIVVKTEPGILTF